MRWRRVAPPRWPQRQDLLAKPGFSCFHDCLKAGRAAATRASATIMARVVIHTLCAIAALSWRAATNDLEETILLFPGMSMLTYRPDQAIRSANELIRAGQESTRAAFARITAEERYISEANLQVSLLCRLLFTPKTPGEALRLPDLGLAGDPARQLTEDCGSGLHFE